MDFLAVVENRLIPASFRSEWDRLKGKGMASLWAPASQDSSHAGHAGYGVVSLRGAPVAFPTCATAQLRRIFDCGRAVCCLLPVCAGMFMHLVVLYGYQGADTDAEQLDLTEQLFDAALGELGVVARRQPCLIVGDFNVEPTKIPCLAKGVSAGKCTWESSCRVEPDRWIVPHPAVRADFDCGRWTCGATQPTQRTPLWRASWLLAVDKSRGSKSGEVQRVWEIHDDRLQLMAGSEVMLLDESLRADDVSRAWLVWSGAAEGALADAYGFAGGPVLSRGLVWERGSARFRIVRLGGPKVGAW